MISNLHINQLLKSRETFWFYVIVFTHLILWTLTPILIRSCLPMDALECTIWGHQLQWGYDKNPFLNGWLAALALIFDFHTGWGTYFLSQLSVVVGLWAIWQLAKRMLPPVQAVMAALILEASQYYNFHAVDFNDNTLELSMWALTILFFYRSIRDNSWLDWLLLSVFTALSFLTKYYIAMLLLPMALFMFVEPEARVRLREWKFYFACAIFLVLITPHFLWLFSHDFVTANYALNRLHGPPTWIKHIVFPLKFTWAQFITFLPCVILLGIILYPQHQRPSRRAILNFNDRFVVIIGLCPFIFTILLSLLTGVQLRGAWGQPLLSLWGIMLFLWLQPEINTQQWKRFLISIFTLLFLFLTAYSVSLLRAPQPSSAIFPGKEIAAALTNEWHDLYHTPIKFVAGPRWLAGNVAFYSSDRPSVYIDANKKLSPWVDEAALRKSGAIFVWDPTERNQISVKEIQSRFQHLGSVRVMQFGWTRNAALAPVKIMVAFLEPPEGRMNGGLSR